MQHATQRAVVHNPTTPTHPWFDWRGGCAGRTIRRCGFFSAGRESAYGTVDGAKGTCGPGAVCKNLSCSSSWLSREIDRGVLLSFRGLFMVRGVLLSSTHHGSTLGGQSSRDPCNRCYCHPTSTITITHINNNHNKTGVWCALPFWFWFRSKIIP